MSDQEQAAPQAGGDQKEGSKEKQSSRPAGFREWAMRFGAVGNCESHGRDNCNGSEGSYCMGLVLLGSDFTGDFYHYYLL